MTTHSSDQRATRRLLLELQRPLRFGELRSRDLKAAMQRAGVLVISVDRPINTQAVCARCERPMGKAYPIDGRFYGEKCARAVRRGETE